MPCDGSGPVAAIGVQLGLVELFERSERTFDGDITGKRGETLLNSIRTDAQEILGRLFRAHLKLVPSASCTTGPPIIVGDVLHLLKNKSYRKIKVTYVQRVGNFVQP